MANVGDPRLNYRIKFTPFLVLKNEGVKVVVCEDVVRLRDVILKSVSSLTFDQLTGINGRDLLKKAILSDVNNGLRAKIPDAVVDVLFTDFVITGGGTKNGNGQ
ncbi:MAG: flagellar basal body-associated FliL family protein [Magnetococcus sp. WYHC-3]